MLKKLLLDAQIMFSLHIISDFDVIRAYVYS